MFSPIVYHSARKLITDLNKEDTESGVCFFSENRDYLQTCLQKDGLSYL